LNNQVASAKGLNGKRRSRGSRRSAHRRWRRRGGGRIPAAGGARAHHDNGGRLDHQSWQRSGASSDEERAVAGTESEARDLGRGGSGTPDPTCRKLERSWRSTRTVHAEKERENMIRWERRNRRLNGKTERKLRDERDGVLTFGQR
jgi:hypothetical protein